MTKHLTQEHFDVIVRDYHRRTNWDIARELGCTAETVKKHARRLGLPKKPSTKWTVTAIGDRTLLARTCIGCGRLCMAVELPTAVSRSGTRRHLARCYACTRRLAAGYKDRHRMHDEARRARVQAATKQRAHRLRYPWTADEDLLVVRDDLTIPQLAVQLGRTYGSVVNRRMFLRGRTS